MIRKYFKNKNLMTNTATYLNPTEIIPLLSCNKDLRRILNPLTNPTINIIFYNYVENNFFEIGEDYELESPKKNRNNFCDDFWKSSINWKLYLNQILGHFKIYPDKKIAHQVLNSYKFHIYLSDLRKENYNLEFSYSSPHQLILYDKKFKDACTYNYYRHFINDNYINNHGNGYEIKILRENSFFENELKCFINIYDEILSKDNNRNLLNLIINYDFEKLDNYYENIIKNNMASNINNIIFFVLWCNKGFILYCNEILETINRYNNDEDESKYLETFNTKYNNYINTALLINNNFENVNIIINFLNIFIARINVDEKFWLYELSRKIFENIIYSKISEKIINKTSILFTKFLNSEIKKPEKMDTEQDETSDTSMSMDSSFYQIKKINNPKRTIENVLNSFLDTAISKDNANAISHSKIIIPEFYEKIENALLTELKDFINNYLNQKNPVKKLFGILEKFFKIESILKTSIFSDNKFKFINRTSNKFINESWKILFYQILKNISNDFKSRLSLKNDKRILNLDNAILSKEKEFSYDLSDLSRRQKIKVEDKVKEELNNIKTMLYEENVMGYDIKETNELADEYLNNNNELVLLMKKMLYYNYKESELCNERDEKIYSILSDKRNENKLTFIKGFIN